MDSIYKPNYKLGAKYSRQTFLQGGVVSLYILYNVNLSAINLDAFCMDKNTEVCAIKL